MCVFSMDRRGCQRQHHQLTQTQVLVPTQAHRAALWAQVWVTTSGYKVVISSSSPKQICIYADLLRIQRTKILSTCACRKLFFIPLVANFKLFLIVVFGSFYINWIQCDILVILISKEQSHGLNLFQGSWNFKL